MSERRSRSLDAPESNEIDVRNADGYVNVVDDTPIYVKDSTSYSSGFRYPRTNKSLWSTLFGVTNGYGYVSWLFLLPFVIAYLFFVAIPLWIFSVIFRIFAFVWEYKFLLFFLFTLGAASAFIYSEYDVILSQGLYQYRCRVVPYWKENYEEVLEGVTEGYNDGVCWFNLMTQTNRIITGQMLIRMFKNCDNGFSLKNWIVLTLKTITHFAKILLIWVYETKTLDTAIASRLAFRQLYMEWIPLTNDGFVCACEDAEFLTLWFTRTINHESWVCFSHQIANFTAALVQVPVSFMFDWLRFILGSSYNGDTVNDIRDAFENYQDAGNTLPSLSKAIPKERLSAAAAYAGIGLNHVVTATYCHFSAQIDGLGVPSAALVAYDACYNDPTNHYDLFGIAGPLVASWLRLMSLQTKFLIHFVEIWNDVSTLPPGYRYTIDQLWKLDTNRVFDTVRPRRVTMNYTQSVNYPTPSVFSNGTNPIESTIVFFNNSDLYGNTTNATCDSYFNDRNMVACSECGIVVDYPFTVRLNITAHELDRLMSNFISMRIWTPTLGISLVALAEAATEAARFLSGFFIHVLNRDRLLYWLTDQNLYDHFFDALAGKPYQFGGFPLGIRTALVEFDARLYCLGNLVMKVPKAQLEALRIFTTLLCRFFNTLDTTNGEPTFKTYMCISSADCMELERSLIWLRRPRLTFGYDPTFGYVAPALFIGSGALEPAFLDCICWLLDYDFLLAFTPTPTSNLPPFCCFVHYYARWSIENTLIFVELGISVIESAMTFFDSTAGVRIVAIEYVACIDYYRCSNMAAILSDVEDLLNCGCVFLFWLSDTIDPNRNAFPCICDFLSATIQWWVYTERYVLEFWSILFDILVCLTNGWPLPQCTPILHARFSAAFFHMETSWTAISGMWGGLGCVLGLPWVGLEVNCLGTRYTWFPDHNPCNTSQDGYGICTMADRLRMVAFYISEWFQVVFKFFYQRVQLIVDLGFGVILPGSVSDNTISLAIQRFLLLIREPLFGRSNRLLNTNFDSVTGGPFPNFTGLNQTKLNQTLSQYQNVTNIQGYSYEFPSSATVYNRTFSYVTIPGLNQTTGLIQAASLTLNCLLGLPTSSCVGPLLYAASDIVGNTGCLGDIGIVIANGLRDVYTMIVKFITNGLNVIEVLFFNPDGFGEAVRVFINSFFELLIVILENIQRLIEAVLMVIIEVARFVLGDGVAEMLKFFLTFIANVIGAFITVIKSLLFFFLKKRVETSDGHAFEYRWDPKNDDFYANLGNLNVEIKTPETANATTYPFGKELLKNSKRLSDLVSDYYSMGYERIYVTKKSDRTNETDADKKRNEEDPIDWVELWKRFNFASFTYQDAESMTDGTFCKKAMMELTPKTGYVDFGELSLANELIWDVCFIAYSLPNEIYGMTGGQLSLDPDTFYNLEKMERLASSTLETFKNRVEWNAQEGGFTPYTPDYALVTNQYDEYTGDRLFNYTINADLPKSIMELVALQIEQRRQNVQRDLFVSSFQYTTLASKTTTKRLETENALPKPGYLEASKTHFKDIRKRMDIYESDDGDDETGSRTFEWINLSDDTCVPFVRSDVNGCYNLDHYEPGFIVRFGRNSVDDISDVDWLNPRYWSNGHPDAHVLNLFNDSNVTIYTTLRGAAYVYSTTTNTSYPIVNGKISYKTNRTSFVNYTKSLYGEESAASRVASYSVQQSKNAELENYLNMLNNIKGDATPKDQVNNYFDGIDDGKDPLDDLLRPDYEEAAKQFKNLKRNTAKQGAKMVVNYAKVKNLLNDYSKWMERLSMARTSEAPYTSHLYRMAKESASEETFAKHFQKSSNFFADSDTTEGENSATTTYLDHRFVSTTDNNVVWAKTISSNPVYYETDRIGEYVLKRTTVNNRHALHWDEIETSDEKTKTNVVSDYFYKPVYRRKKDGEADAMNIQKLRTIDRLWTIQRHVERPLKEFSFYDYFTKTIPEAVKHYAYDVSRIGYTFYDRKLKRADSYEEYLYSSGTTSLAMALRLRSEDDDTNDRFDAKHDFFVLDSDRAWSAPEVKPDGSMEQRVLYDRRIKKLFKIIYVIPSDEDDEPDALSEKMEDLYDGHHDAAGYSFYMDKDDHLLKYALSYLNAHSHAFENFQEIENTDHNHVHSRVFHLGFDKYELHDYATFHERPYCKKETDDENESHIERKRLYAIARRLYCKQGCHQDKNGIVYLDLGFAPLEKPVSPSSIKNTLTRYLERRFAYNNNNKDDKKDGERAYVGPAYHHRIVLRNSSVYGKIENPEKMDDFTFNVSVSNLDDSSLDDEWMYDFTSFSMSWCFKKDKLKKHVKNDKEGMFYKKQTTFSEFITDVVTTRYEKTKKSMWETIQRALQHVRKRHTMTYDMGRMPSLDRSLILLFDPNNGYVSQMEEYVDTSDYLPNIEKRSDMLNHYLKWSSSHPYRREDDKNGTFETKQKRQQGGDVFKTSVNLQYCLPRNPSDPNITRCATCSSCNSEYCSDCNDCALCFLNSNGTHSCESCSNCRFNGPFCSGECVECEDCYESEPCINCRLVEHVLKKLVYTANQCYATSVLNQSIESVYPQKSANWNFVETIPLNANEAIYPSFSDYGILGIVPFVYRTILTWINNLLKFNLVQTIVHFFTNTNFSIIQGDVGFIYVAWEYLIGPCDIDTNVACTFGLGFETGFIVGTAIVFVFTVPMWMIDPRLAGLFSTLMGLLSTAGIVWFWAGLVAYLSWFYSPKCYVSGSFFLLTNLFGWSILPSFYLPMCAMNEIKAFSAKIFGGIVLPSYIVVNNVTMDTPCDVVEEIVDCSQFGFIEPFSVNGLFSIIGYIGQRWFPENVQVWLIDYLNRTALGSNVYIAGSSGPLNPLYVVNYNEILTEDVLDAADFCFYLNLPFVIFVLALIVLLFLLLVYLLYTLWSFLSPVFAFFYDSPFCGIFSTQTFSNRNAFRKNPNTNAAAAAARNANKTTPSKTKSSDASKKKKQSSKNKSKK